MIVSSPRVQIESHLLEVDHLVIYTSEPTVAISMLQELGLHSSDQIIRREKQGTASTLFFFENTYLEIVWSEDNQKVKQYKTETNIDIISRANWKQTGAAPFAIGLRQNGSIGPQIGDKKDQNTLQSLKAEGLVSFASDNLTTLSEPICYSIPDSMALTTWLNSSVKEHRKLVNHPINIKRLTNLEFTLTQPNLWTRAISFLVLHNLLSLKQGTTTLLELTFDHHKQGKLIDARPILPLVLKY
ncbi:VOC family protein [Crocosphaera sp. Alani8]|uniref:VOC family protein n=1 Tax=Crocosphaera sp. Alani8 TaxID=3038952 RepID=UPI00313CDA0C